MKRRAFFLQTTSLVSLALSARGAAAEPGQSGLQDVTVIYVGGHDCPPCDVWKRLERAKWLASDLRRKVRYVEIDAQHFKQSYQERYWPQDLLPVLASLPQKSGAPRFLVVKGGMVTSNDLGTSHWPHTLKVLSTVVG
jgi:hypothetical protein